MKCNKCGLQYSNNVKFCLQCGSPLTADSSDSKGVRPECDNCGTVNIEGSVFCKKCGTRLATVQNGVRCAKCNKLNSANTVYCSKCGTRINAGKDDAPREYEKEKPVIEKKFIIIGAGILCAVIAVILVVVLLINRDSGDSGGGLTQLFKGESWSWNDNYPQVPDDPVKDGYVIFNEGYRDNRVELATFNIGSEDVSDVNVVWNGSLKLSNQNLLQNCDQYYLENGRWERISTAATFICDYAAGVLASNLEVYDGTGSLVLEKNDFSEKLASSEGTAIHKYEYYVSDSGWQSAFDKAKQSGGYLAHINSQEEFNYIVNELKTRSNDVDQFYIGGRRDLYDSKYYWVDGDNELFGTSLNDSMSNWFWMEGEPSIKDKNIKEAYISILYFANAGTWAGNDVIENIVSVYPEFSEKVGYIIEYEN